MTHELTLTIGRDQWMSANRILTNHQYRRRIIDGLHTLTAATARQQHLDRIRVPVVADWTIHYPLGVGHKADPTNAHPVCKAILDALAPVWLTDDSPRFVVEERYRRGPNLTVRELHRVVLRLIPATEVGV